jgi:hypothetical protein
MNTLEEGQVIVPLKKNEQFAVSLRKQRKQQILNGKRGRFINANLKNFVFGAPSEI